MRARGLLLAGAMAALALAGSPAEGSRHLRVDDVAAEIMSPVCPGKLLIHCPSSEGAQIRRLVQKMIDEGKGKEEIITYLAGIYGREILPKPPFSGFFLSAWLLPFAGLVSGAGLVLVLVGAWARRRHTGDVASPGGEEAKKVKSELEEKLDSELKKFDF